MKDGQKSEIDVFFEALMGYIPSKSGTAYEKIATAAYSIIKGVRAEHDRHLEGLSQNSYQIDGLIDGKEMLEAKDYTVSKDKVGRQDIQKQEGALIDLPNLEKGIFASATGYTAEATKYAVGSLDNDKMTNIIPYDIRPSSKNDERGRIKRIHVTMNTYSLCYNRGNFSLIFAEGEQKRLHNTAKAKGLTEISSHIEFFYDENGNIIDDLANLSRRCQPIYNCNDIEVCGTFLIDAFVKLGNSLYRIKGIKYEHVPIIRGIENFIIESKGKAVLLIKSELDGVNKLITDFDLRAAIEQIDNNGKKRRCH